MNLTGRDNLSGLVGVGGNRAGKVARRVLGPLSLLYRVVIDVRNRLYDRNVFKIRWMLAPVISVGNLTTGGTGKTPTVIYLARKLQEWGYQPGVILRGYGAHGGQPSDEERLFRRNLAAVPIVADPDRVLAARRALAQSANVLLADDAYQHRRLGRDMNICLIDATFPFGNAAMLPAGRLREPPASLSRADLVIITRSDQASAESLTRLCEYIKTCASGIPILLSRHEPAGVVSLSGEEYNLNYLSGKSVLAFSGIARPEAFYLTLTQLGAKLVDTMRFPDHHHYTRDDLIRLAERSRRCGATMLVCTAKDAVKLDPDRFGSARLDPNAVLALMINMRFSDEHERILCSVLREMLSNFSRAVLEETRIYVPADQ